MSEVHNTILANALAAQMARMNVQAHPEQMESSTNLTDDLDSTDEPAITDIAEGVHREAAQSLINTVNDRNKASYY